jgi:LysM repeat protein
VAVATAYTPSSGTIRVAAGDALSTIASRYHTTVAGLVAANRIADPNLVVAGQLLRLPGMGSTAATYTPSSGTIRVAAGDALSTIASRYHTTVAGLVAANRIADPNLVDAGQLLRLPGAGSTGSTYTPSTVGALPANLLAYPDRLTLRSDFVREALAHGVPVSLLEAVCWWESGWQAGVVSSTGAVGVCQIEPSTAAYVNSVLVPGRRLDVHSPADNITMAAAYLHQLLVGAGGNQSVAIGSYYQGLASVKRRGMLPETRAYVNGIRAYVPIFAATG